MVQRKAPDKPKSSIEHKCCHGGLERQSSSHLQQDARNRVGADLKKVKSMKVSDFNSFEHSPMDIQFKKTSLSKKISYNPIRNYMKPTSSSDARKEMLQVRDKKKSPISLKILNLSSSSSSSSPEVVKALIRQSSLKSVKSSMKKCSVAALCGKKKSPISLKNLNPSSSSSSSSSASPNDVKVLIRQSSLKPLKSAMKKCTVAAALCGKKKVNRGTCSSTLKDSKFPAALELDHGATEAEGTSKIRVCPYTYCSLNGHVHEPLPPLKHFISARRNLLKTQRSLKLKRLSSFRTNLLRKEGEMIDDEFEDEIGKNLTDLFVEIYAMAQDETTGENYYDEISIFEENNHEQGMSQMNESSDISFEYDYDKDQKSEFAQDEVDDVMMNFLESHLDCEVDGEMKKSEIETMDVNCGDEICFLPDNMEVSEFPDNHSYATSEEPEDDLETEEGNSNVIEKDNSDISEFNSQSINEEVQNLQSETMNCQSDDCSVEDESKNPEKELLDSSNGIDKNTSNVSDVVLSSRWNITKKKTTEEFQQVKEFNPRPPNFLLLEPDPDAEKVDLRHQIMDERRNSEEWMIDHALQQAVTKLGSARKKKVALLVEAFETVLPLPMCEKPLSHGTSAFNHLSFVQACN